MEGRRWKIKKENKQGNKEKINGVIWRWKGDGHGKTMNGENRHLATDYLGCVKIYQPCLSLLVAVREESKLTTREMGICPAFTPQRKEKHTAQYTYEGQRKTRMEKDGWTRIDKTNGQKGTNKPGRTNID